VMRGGLRQRACLAGVALLVGLLSSGAPGASASHAGASDNPRIFCAIERGPTWTAGGRSGNTWYVAGLSTGSECKNAANWAVILGKKITGPGGAAVQAFRSGAFACVVTRASLEAACYLGNGGPGAVGVIVIGNPARNSLIPASIRLHLPPVVLHVASPADDPQAGIPEPWIGGRTCSGNTALTGPEWSFLLPDGTPVRGTRWTVESFDFFTDADCSAIRDLWPAIAHSVDRSGQAPSTSATSVSNGRSWVWQHGSWGCVSARDFTVAPASAYAATGDATPGDHTVGLPFAGCARSTFPNGTRNTDHSPALAAALEQVVVYPNVEVGTTGVPSTQIRALDNRVAALHDALSQYGVSVVALEAVTSQKLDQAPPRGTVIPSTSPPTGAAASQACGGNYRNHWPATPVPSAPWTSHGGSGTTWALATAGGYPCELADPVFKVFLANLTSSSAAAALSRAQLHRYGWECSANRTDLIATCRFSPESFLDRLRTAVGRTVPSSFRIGIAASPVPGVANNRVATALNATG
jgi:hypothetical protein